MMNKKRHTLIGLGLIVSGCMSQSPSYLKTITPTELHKLMQKEDIFLVDVHTPKQRHIKNTDVFIPYDAVEMHKDKLPQDKNAAIYVYCEGGPMGNTAAKTLYALGYRNLTNLEGGAKAWRELGYELE